MSKSSWTDLPDVKDEGAYRFIEGACGEEWAWEFLRRLPEYQADWDKYGSGKQTVVFIPPMKPEDMGSRRRWVSRTLEEGSEEPRTLYVDDYAAERWGLKKLAPYDQPHGKAVIFLKSVSTYPMLVRREEELKPFFEEIGGHDGTPLVNVAVPDKAVFVFDLGTSILQQIKAALMLLKCVYEHNRAFYKIKRTSLPKKETEHLVRHLRVLDLLRTTPDISCAHIALSLGYDETLTGKNATQQGARWKDQALAAQKKYRSFLYKSSTTGKGKSEV